MPDQAVLGELAGSGIRAPTTVRQGSQNPLFFAGLPVRWADADIVKYPDVGEMLPSRFGVGPSRTQAQGALFGLRFASGLNTRLLKTRKPRTGVTIAVARPTAADIPDQRSARLLGPRGYVTPFPSGAPNRWDAVGGGTAGG